jgi:hypothetical protein
MKKRREDFDMMQKLAQTLLIGMIAMQSFGCNNHSQHFEERAGRWFVTSLPEGSPEYSFAPLDLSWEAIPPPTDNCALFFGKKDEGTHIGVFLHPIKPGVDSEFVVDSLPKILMASYLSSNDQDSKSVIIPPQSFGNGIYASCENIFTIAGAKVRAFEAFIIIPTSQHLMSFTFKRRIEVDNWDFRREQGDQVILNELKKMPEHEEFLAFVRGASFWDVRRTLEH